MLTRSRIEITRILAEVAAKDGPVSAYLDNGELLFVARILEVDANADKIVLNYSVSKSANSVLFSAKKIILNCENRNLRVRFPALSLVQIAYQGVPAI